MSATSLVPPATDRGGPAPVRAQRRLEDARLEFDAAVQEGLPMVVLVAREHEVLLATAALEAAGVETAASAGAVSATR